MRYILPLALLQAPVSAMACIPAPPLAKLKGEKNEAFDARAKGFRQTREAEEGRRYQGQLFDRAERVSLARVTAKRNTNRVLSDGLSLARRIEVTPLAAFKGVLSPSAAPVALEDKSMTTCGPIGAGSATWAAVGDYVLLFENVGSEAYTGNIELLLGEIREPRITETFVGVARRAGLLQAQ